MLNGIKAVIFDLDGTLYFGNDLAPGALNVLDYLHRKNIKVFYFTNNSSRTRAQIYEKLVRMGLPGNIEQVYNSAYAAGLYAKSVGLQSVYCVGTDDLKAELASNGINVLDRVAIADAIIIGMDMEFDFAKLGEVLDVYNLGCHKIIACNSDKNYPVEKGKIVPGVGCIVSAIETACDRQIDYLVGKPSPFMMELLMDDNGLQRDEMLVVGDSYASDIQIAKKFGCKSVLISNDNKYNDVPVISELSAIINLFDKAI